MGGRSRTTAPIVPVHDRLRSRLTLVRADAQRCLSDSPYHPPVVALSFTAPDQPPGPRLPRISTANSSERFYGNMTLVPVIVSGASISEAVGGEQSVVYFP
jgi:hypothetical protein